jgi:hypothetical protein
VAESDIMNVNLSGLTALMLIFGNRLLLLQLGDPGGKLGFFVVLSRTRLRNKKPSLSPIDL